MQKKKYIKPSNESLDFLTETLMITFSGETTPEEADAKRVWYIEVSSLQDDNKDSIWM